MQRRYAVVAGACVTQFTVIGLLFCFGLLIPVFEEAFGWSRTFLSACNAVAFFMMGTLAMGMGRLSDAFGPRVVLFVTGLVYGLGFAAISQVDAPWQLFLIFALPLAIGMGSHDVVTLSTVARWFEARRGLMTSVAKLGTAAGQMLVPQIAVIMIAALGWRSAMGAMGLAACVLLVFAALLMSRPEAKAAGAAAEASGASFAEARRQRLFWTVCAMQFLFFPTLTTVPLHIAPHGMDLGLAELGAASLLSAAAAGSVAGRLAVGALADRIGGRKAYFLCHAPLILALLALAWLRTPETLFAVMALYGFGHGGFFVVVSPTVAELFGTRAHGAIFGVVLFCGTIGGAIGPILAGAAFDGLGSYTPAFLTLAAMAAISLGLAATLPGPAQRDAAAR